MPRLFRCFLVLLLSLSAAACTRVLWESSYTDHVRGFLVAPEKHYVLVVGDEYLYAFSVQQEFEKTLLLSRRLAFKPWFNFFQIDAKGAISGEVSLDIPIANLSEADNRELFSLGFRMTGDKKTYRQSTNLKGLRFTPQEKMAFQEVKSAPAVEIAKPNSGVEAAGKAILTPATIALDAPAVALVLGGFTFIAIDTFISGP